MYASWVKNPAVISALASGPLYLSHPTLAARVSTSGSCRYCCKSPKLPGADFLAVKKSDRRPPIDVAPITLPRSPASLSSGNEVPHIFTRKSRVQPKEILITSAKRLLQQNRPGADQCTAANDVHGFMAYSTTLSARIRKVSGTSSPIAFAVLRLITNSNVVGCSTGTSWGRSPRNSLATSTAT